MYKSELTQETILEVTDFCDQGDEKSTKDWWEQKVNTLKQECGG
jgi:hypothetical protein